MKKITLLFLLVIATITLKAQNPHFANGDGSSNHPFEIETAQQLDNLRFYLNEAGVGKYFKITKDIDLANHIATNYPVEGWKPIGGGGTSNEYTNPFCGNVDGGGKTIKNLWINRPNEYYVGLFGYMENDKLSNINVIIGNNGIKGDAHVGALCGSIGPYINETPEAEKYIENCTVSGGTVYGQTAVGGIFGTIRGSLIRNCKNKANIDCLLYNINGSFGVGGIVGYGYKTLRIINCSNSGNITSAVSIQHVGGIIGLGPAFIDNCSNSGNIKGWSVVSGIAGEAWQVRNSKNSGNIEGNSNVSGITRGDLISIIDNCSNSGNITGKVYVGGINAICAKMLSNSHNFGAIVGHENIGGIAGIVEDRCTNFKLLFSITS